MTDFNVNSGTPTPGAGSTPNVGSTVPDVGNTVPNTGSTVPNAPEASIFGTTYKVLTDFWTNATETVSGGINGVRDAAATQFKAFSETASGYVAPGTIPGDYFYQPVKALISNNATYIGHGAAGTAGYLVSDTIINVTTGRISTNAFINKILGREDVNRNREVAKIVAGLGLLGLGIGISPDDKASTLCSFFAVAAINGAYRATVARHVFFCLKQTEPESPV